MKGNAVQFYLNENIWSHLNNYEGYRKWAIVYNRWKKQNKIYEYLESIRKKYAYRQEPAGHTRVNTHTHTDTHTHSYWWTWVLGFELSVFKDSFFNLLECLNNKVYG